MSIFAQKSVLFQYICFGFIGLTMMFSGALLNSANTQDFDNGSAISTPTVVEKAETPEQPTAEIAASYKKPATAAASAKSNSGTKTLAFSQSVREVAFYSNGNYCTTVDAGTGIVHCSGTNFYFAHRAYAFSQLKNANIGDTIVVDGHSYTVRAKFQRALTSADMNDIVASRYNGQQYGASFMTCAGAGDRERLVIFAN